MLQAANTLDRIPHTYPPCSHPELCFPVKFTGLHRLEHTCGQRSAVLEFSLQGGAGGSSLASPLSFLYFLGTKVKRHDDLFLPVLHMIYRSCIILRPFFCCSSFRSVAFLSRAWRVYGDHKKSKKKSLVGLVGGTVLRFSAFRRMFHRHARRVARLVDVRSTFLPVWLNTLRLCVAI
jgi:hypothetical protein